MENMQIYNAGRITPAEAKKKIQGGRINGLTDINPMWRIRKLTEIFGPCGIGWYYTIDREWLEGNESTGEVAAFVRISLYVKADGEWSKPIPGVGGSMFAASESRGIRVSDECYKMAQTDAISVACKNLGIGADVYWEAGETKYSRMQAQEERTAAPSLGEQIGAYANQGEPVQFVCADCGKPFEPLDIKGKHYDVSVVWQMAKNRNTDGVARCKECREKAGTTKDEAAG